MKILAISMMLLGFFLFIFFFMTSVRGIKDKGETFTLLKNWAAISHPQKKGEMAIGTLISWKQTSTMNNFDYYFIFTFEAEIEGKKKTYNAAAVVKVADISKLKKGLPMTFKYTGNPPDKLAVIDVIYDPQ
ncbi:hypothetical protein [Kosakonia oryzendophytica]|uniref:hypothetical protein n=1 Tax=Kosakonia oryzendophytica TaxID=1005665 RepID=UPI000900F348|nr:hypothetical protein [Kosakonia oryzendophytica]TDT59278.1 hypothetical protein DFO53_0849 [Enterobacter sp. AG5470]WBT60225.1 hypothetical protein O9K67_10860 [Kosakonia oryzendophytica]